MVVLLSFQGKPPYNPARTLAGNPMQTNGIVIDAHGGPEVLRWQVLDLPDPGPGEVRVRHRAVGVNFIDIYFREGLYPLPSLPSGLGLEAAGVVEALGPGVAGVAVGDRVAYAGGLPGAYAEARNVPADRLVPLPPDIPFETVAAGLLKGMTAEYLLCRLWPLQPGDPVLVHAAAGGVGILLCQWARHLGLRVLGTVGSPGKARLAAAHGCEVPILYREEDFVARVRRETAGEGVAVVFDSVGRETFEGSLECLRPRGLLALYGQSSGPVPPFDPAVLARKGSLFLTRPTLFTYTARREDLLASAGALFDRIRDGTLAVSIGGRYLLAEAARAQRDLQSRATAGSLVLIPGD